MRIAFDGTPAATQFAGVGRYARELLRALLEQDHADRYQIICAASQPETDLLERSLPPGQWRNLHRLPLPERATTIAWQRLRLPLPLDLLINDFDLYHGTDFVLPPLRKPAVVTIHDLSYLVAPQFGEPALVRYLTSAVPRALKRADQVIAVSASVAAELVDAYPFVEHKVRAIPNGATIPVTTVKSQEHQPTLLMVGTIEPRKNHDLVLDAMPHVWNHEPDVKLVIAGRIGWQSERIVRRIREAVATSTVEFVEAPPDHKLEALYRSATIALYPSRYEGFGLPVVESMGRGVPVIASDIPVLRETGGNVARYVSLDDPEEMAGAILDLLNDAHSRQELGTRGLERANQFTWAETARRTRLAYLAALEG